MELVAIALARVAAFLEVQGIDPMGRTSTPAALKSLGERYSFMQVPQNFAEMDFQKGIELQVGKLDEINIDKLTVYGNGIAVDTRSSTDDSEKVLEDLLEAAKQTFGAIVKPGRKLFLSHLIFRSNVQLANLNSVLQKIADAVASSVSQSIGQTVAFEPTLVGLNVDPATTKLTPSPFTIERRVDTPFSENLYFSVAPVRTAEHLELLREFETAVGA